MNATVDKVPYLDLATQIRNLRPELEAALAKTLDQCSFCLGPDVAQFEQDFAQFVGSKFCIATNSGTSALHIAALLLDLKPGDEVITTPFTFAATSWCISYVGARPVYVDIQPDTFNLDPDRVAAAITSRTKAILPVHLYGHPCDMDPLMEISRKHGLKVIEDAAQAHGAVYHGKSAGTIGPVSCFSFYPTKNLGACGEGGALLTDDPEWAARAKSLREHGSRVRYQHDEVGFNYRLEGFQGAILRVKLKHLAAWTAARRAVAQRYQALLQDTPLVLPQERSGVSSAWHLYTIRSTRRDALKAWLDQHGIGCAVHYPVPLHLQPCYASLGYQSGQFPIAEQASREVLCLPMYPELTAEQQQRVSDVIHAFFA